MFAPCHGQQRLGLPGPGPGQGQDREHVARVRMQEVKSAGKGPRMHRF